MRRRFKSGVFAGLTPKQAAFVREYVKDFAPRRAAEASLHDPDEGSKMLRDPAVMAALERIMTEAADDLGIDAEWLLMELVDNHRIARHQGNISASNAALLTIAKHVSVDALASDKQDILIAGEKELLERLKRGRMRNAKREDDDTQEPSFL